jgi:hypothetical protein
MALLKFKKGLLEQIPTAKAEGTVYITTDEKAMYVDVDNSTRIRIGQIVEKTSSEWEKLPKPYDASTYYYITDINALVRWNETKSQWVQINSTGDLKTKIAALETTVNGDGTTGNTGLVGKVGALETKTNSLDLALNGDGTEANKGLVGKVDQLIVTGGEANVVDGATAGGNAVSIENKKLVLGKFAAANKTDIAFADLNKDVTDRITGVETVAANAATKTELQTAQNTLQGNINTVDGKIDAVSDKLGTTFTAESTVADQLLAATNRIGVNENAISNHGTRIGALETLTTQHTTKIGENKTAAENAQTAANNAQTTANEAKTAAQNAQTTANGAQTAAEGAQTTADRAEGKADSNTTAISGVSTRVKAIEDDYINQAKLNAAIKTVNDAAGTLGEKVTANENAIKTLNETTIPGINTTIEGHGTRLTEVETLAASKVAQTDYDKKVGELEKAIGDAAALGQKGIDDAKDASDAAKAADTKAQTAQNEVDALETVVSKLKEDIGALENVMNFRGAVPALPENGEGYEVGDVIVVVGTGEEEADKNNVNIGKEFVYDATRGWVEIGDTKAETAAIAALTARMDTAEGDIDDLEDAIGTETTEGSILYRVKTAEGQISANETALADRYTKAETNQAIADAMTWGSF